jgi:alpha-methylacyl-CoA racemase
MSAMASQPGPLAGVRVVEVGGIGPVPFCGMVLADLGAAVTRVTRPGRAEGAGDPLLRGRETLELDLKRWDGRDRALDLVAGADALIEGFRPGVMERLGLGPGVCRERNPRLVFGRMTGWGQSGPYAARAGHDINFLAQSGTLAALGPRGGPPAPPLNLLGDFGGGGLLLAFGLVSAILAARESGQGQVVDAAMVDGAALLATMVHGFRAAGEWGGEPGTNLLDGGAPFYRAYECADGGHVAVGAIEPRFYADLLAGLELDPAALPERDDRNRWDELAAIFARAFLARTRDEWAERFAALEACVSPVLTLEEAPRDPHSLARGAFLSYDGVLAPAPAPRFRPLGGVHA